MGKDCGEKINKRTLTKERQKNEIMNISHGDRDKQDMIKRHG